MKASEEDLRVACRVIEQEAGVPFDSPVIRHEFIQSYNLARLVDRIATALTAARAETWKEAIKAAHANLNASSSGTSDYVSGFANGCIVRRTANNQSS